MRLLLLRRGRSHISNRGLGLTCCEAGAPYRTSPIQVRESKQRGNDSWCQIQMRPKHKGPLIWRTSTHSPCGCQHQIREGVSLLTTGGPLRFLCILSMGWWGPSLSPRHWRCARITLTYELNHMRPSQLASNPQGIGPPGQKLTRALALQWAFPRLKLKGSSTHQWISMNAAPSTTFLRRFILRLSRTFLLSVFVSRVSFRRQRKSRIRTSANRSFKRVVDVDARET